MTSPPACWRDAVLDRILDQRLEDERRHPDVAQRRRHVDRTRRRCLEARALDIQVRLDEVDLPAERGELAFGAQDAAQQRGEPHQRLQRPRRRRLDQVADGRQRVEEEVRIDLRAQGAQLRFGGELAVVLLAELALVTFPRDAKRVDAARDQDRDRLQAAVSSDSSRRPPWSA